MHTRPSALMVVLCAAAIHLATAPPAAARRVAVLPPVNVSSEPSHDALALGVGRCVSEMLEQLAASRAEFGVIPADSVRSLGAGTLGETLARLDADEALAIELRVVDDLATVSIRILSAETPASGRSIDAAEEVARLAAAPRLLLPALDAVLGLGVSFEDRMALARVETTPETFELFLEGEILAVLDGCSSDRAEATSFYRRAHMLDPSLVEAPAGIAEVLCHDFTQSQNDTTLTRAGALVDSLLAVAPRNPRVRRAHGVYLVVSGRYERGVEALRAVLDGRPGDGTAQWLLGRGLAGLGRRADAETCFVDLIDRRPADWRGHSQLGVERFRSHRIEEATMLLKVAVALNPSRARSWNNLGGVHHHLGDLPRAIEYFERSLQVEPSAHTWRNLGITYFMVWDQENAERALTEAVAIDPASHETWGALAAARQHLHDYEGAKEAYEEALRRGRTQLELTPDVPLLLLDVAGYHGMLDHDEAARELIDEALALGGDDAVVLKEAGQAYEVIGERDRALELVEAALRGGYPLSRFEADPGLATFRSDPRYGRMLERLGLSGRD